jgi:hypothetical protein
MKRIFAAGFVACLLVCVMSGNVFAKSEPGRLDHFRFFEMPAEPMNPPEIGGSMFESAAASTVVLAWYQFDSPGGAPDPQDWTAVDNTVQVTFFHVDGQDGAPCTGAIAPLGGSHSMWCGKEASAESPYCSWLALPGYGNDWDESLASTVNANALTYDIAWDSEDGYDYIFVEWWNASNQTWVVDTSVNGGAGYYTNVGAATGATSSAASAGVTGPTRVRFHFVSDVGWSDEDGMRDSMLPGAVIVDNLRLDAGPVEDWEGESCGAKASEDGAWLVQNRQPYGLYAHLVHSSTIVQEDPCRRVSSNLWAFFDDPAVTNYACGGWPLQGAVPYTHGTDLCIDNAIISPWIPIVGAGSEYVLSFLTYRDLSLDDHVFFDWSIRTRNNDPPANGCPTLWSDDWYYGYGKFKDWATMKYEIGGFVPGSADEIQIALRAYDDFCSDGWPLETCHSHAPLFDQVRIVRVDTDGPQWTIRHIDLWQDNFPELGGIGPTDYARCDMAQDILAGGSKNIVPGGRGRLRLRRGRHRRALATLGLRVRQVHGPLRESASVHRRANGISGRQVVVGRSAGRAQEIPARDGDHGHTAFRVGGLPDGRRVYFEWIRSDRRVLRRPHGSPRRSPCVRPRLRTGGGEHGHLRSRRRHPLLLGGEELARELELLP